MTQDGCLAFRRAGPDDSVPIARLHAGGIPGRLEGSPTAFRYAWPDPTPLVF